MKYIVSRYNHNMEWIQEYSDDVVLYDRSDVPLSGSIVVPNIGSDIYDKFTYIIDNYENLPDIAVYTKANLFKYISREEFDILKDNRSFTPLLTRNHVSKKGFCFYENGIYWELNNGWYLNPHPPKTMEKAYELLALLKISTKAYVPFAPGSNYIVPKENILKHSKEHYRLLRSYLDWTIYPGEAQIMERGLYTLWS